MAAVLSKRELTVCLPEIRVNQIWLFSFLCWPDQDNGEHDGEAKDERADAAGRARPNVETGRDLACTTVATLVRILLEKGFVRQTTEERPFRYEPARSFDEVSSNLVNDLLSRVFGGSTEKLLVSLLDRKKLSKKERETLQRILDEQK